MPALIGLGQPFHLRVGIAELWKELAAEDALQSTMSTQHLQ
jgi:hypothetical protein